jgi:Flp pilus assembly pilin Flp
MVEHAIIGLLIAVLIITVDRGRDENEKSVSGE